MNPFFRTFYITSRIHYASRRSHIDLALHIFLQSFFFSVDVLIEYVLWPTAHLEGRLGIHPGLMMLGSVPMVATGDSKRVTFPVTGRVMGTVCFRPLLFWKVILSMRGHRHGRRTGRPVNFWSATGVFHSQGTSFFSMHLLVFFSLSRLPVLQLPKGHSACGQGTLISFICLEKQYAEIPEYQSPCHNPSLRTKLFRYHTLREWVNLTTPTQSRPNFSTERVAPGHTGAARTSPFSLLTFPQEYPRR